MTEPEKIEDVIAEIEHGKFGDALTDMTIRLRAALERERARQMTCECWREDRAAVLKVAEDMDEVRELLMRNGTCVTELVEWAAGLRRIAGGGK